MKKPNKDVYEIFKGKPELKYFNSFKDINELEEEMQRMVNKGWEYHFESILTPRDEEILVEKDLFDPLFFPLSASSNIFEDFINHKLPEHEKLEFGNRFHIIMRDAYGFYLGMNYLLWENRELPSRKFKNDSLQLKFSF